MKYSIFKKKPNLGMKKLSVPMQPTMNMDTSSKTRNTQAYLKAKEIETINFMIIPSLTKYGPI